jgi:hypothetical protein
MADQVKGAFTVRYLKIGDDVYIIREIYRMDNGERKGASLFQAVDTLTGALSVDWTIPGNQPVVEFRAVSSVGYPANILESFWIYDGGQIVWSTTDPATGWKTSTDGKFQLKHENGRVFFKIIQNIATPTQVANKQIGYNLSYISNGMINGYAGSMDIVIQQAGNDSHRAVIITPRIVLDFENPSTVLTLQATYGVENIVIGQNGYTAEWYQDNTLLEGETGGDLEVTRDMISGAGMFTAKLLHNDVPVAMDGQHISDVADEYQVRTRKIVDFVNKTTNAQFDLYLMKNSVEMTTQDSQWTYEIYNALGVLTKSGQGKSVVINSEDCKNTPPNGGAEYYSDADWTGTVTIL